METNLVPTSSSVSTITFEFSMADIEQLAEEYKDIPEDLSIKANYNLVKTRTSKLRTARTSVEKRRKELKADALEYGRKVDSTAKELTAKIAEIEAPYVTAKTEYDTRIEIEKRETALAEERRVDHIASRIADIKALVEANISSSSGVIKRAINDAGASLINVDEWAMEFSEKAQTTIEESIAKLSELYELKLQQEKAAEAARIAEEERLKKEEAERIQREAEMKAEQERLAAEREAIEAARAKLAAIQAEQEAEQARLQAEAEYLRKQKEEEEQAKNDAKESVPETVSQEVQTKVNTDIQAETAPAAAEVSTSQSATGGYSDHYRAAGNAILSYVGNMKAAKALLEAIIRGDVPHIAFTGEL